MDFKDTQSLRKANTRVNTVRLSPKKGEKTGFSGDILSAIP